MIDTKKIKDEIAVRYGIVMDEDDPIILGAILTDELLQQCVKTLNEQNEAHQRGFSLALDEGIEKSIDQSKKVANRIVNDGTKYVIDQCKAAIEESLKEVEERINKRVVFIVKTREEAVTAKQLALGAAGLSLFFTFVTWGAMLGNWFV